MYSSVTDFLTGTAGSKILPLSASESGAPVGHPGQR